MLENEIALIGGNLARAKDQEAYDLIEAERAKVKAEIIELADRRKRFIATSVGNAGDGATPQEEVEKALALLKNLQRISSNREGRTEIRGMLDELGCRVGLSFVGAIKGKKRPVRKLAGGIIVFGDGELPIKLHGKDRIDGGTGGQQDSGHCQDDCADSRDRGADDRASGRAGGADEPADEFPTSCAGAGGSVRRGKRVIADTNTNEGGNLPSATDVFSTKCHQEEVSFTKVSRADWRHTFPNDNCSSIVIRQLLSETLEFSAETFFSIAAGI